jgi:tetratricopeptide (TPR) repeat protein
MTFHSPDIPLLEWDPTILDGTDRDSVTTALRTYFAQDSSITRVTLRAIAPGRSGAIPFTANVIAERGGGPVQLQSEFVKLVKSSREFENFEQLAAGTALVFGQRLARPVYSDPVSGYSIFGFHLFEQGVEVSSLAAVALANPVIAERALTKLARKLTEWYEPLKPASTVQWNLTDAHLQNLLENLKSLSPTTTRSVKNAIAKAKLKASPGVTTRVHGDLHLENILVPRSGDYSYLIDFGNASKDGSPCMDVARLESDLIYRLLPTNLTPDQVASFEHSLWAGDVEGLQEYIAGYLVLSLRRSLPEVLRSPNAVKWLLAGRIFHGLRMLANTWPQVRPYNLEIRRRAIVASLGVLAGKLDQASEGSAVALIVDNEGVLSPSNEDVYNSLVWMLKNRFYPDAFMYGLEIATARRSPPAHITLLGALAGLSGGSDDPHQMNLLYGLTPSPLRNPRDRGLKKLFQAMQLLRTGPTFKVERAIKVFLESLPLFQESGENFFEAITADQLARAYQENGQIDLAKASFTDSKRLKELIGDNAGLATTLGGLALLHMATLEYEDALNLLLQDLQLARDQEDVRSQIKIHNWLGQVHLQGRANVLQAIEHFQESIALSNGYGDSRYDATLDLAYANLGLGFTYAFTNAVKNAHKHEKVARRLMQRGSLRPYMIGTALCEILSGEIFFLEGLEQSGFLRLKSGLAELRGANEKLTHIDFSIRVCRFLRSNGATLACRQLAREARASMNSREFHFALYKALTELEEA